MDSSLTLVLQFFFPVLLALGVFEFFVFTKAKSHIDACAAALSIFYALVAIEVFGGITSVVAVITLFLAVSIAAAHGGATFGEEIQDRVAAVFYLLVIIAMGAVYLPLAFVA